MSELRMRILCTLALTRGSWSGEMDQHCINAANGLTRFVMTSHHENVKRVLHQDTLFPCVFPALKVWRAYTLHTYTHTSTHTA
jgi:hypothetical protein